jgi:hypothetical protein
MSERSYAPRSGGRTTGTRRDADAKGSDARGARHFSGGTEGEPVGRSDTRRSGMRREEQVSRREGTGTPAARAKSRAGESVRGRGRDGEPVRSSARESVRGRGRDGEPVRSSARESVRGRGRDGEPVRSSARESVRGRSRDGESVRSRGRDGEPVRSSARESVRGRTRDGATPPVKVRETRLTSRAAGTPGGRGRRPTMDAPVAGTAALQVEVAAAEPLRITDPQLAPRLQVAPPAPISVPRAPFVAAMIGVVIVGVLGILLINTKTNENSFRIADLQNQASKLDSQQQDLDNQLVEISSIGHLDAAARRLGLIKADKPALIRLPDGKMIGVPAPATGEPAVTAQDAKTDGTGDKGAANIIPQNGSPAEGLTPNGTATAGTGTGTTPNGTANGAAANGAAANGAVTDGAANGGAATVGAGQ